jgi:hypothetical protein
MRPCVSVSDIIEGCKEYVWSMLMETTRIGMPLDEFIRQHDEQPFELI